MIHFHFLLFIEIWAFEYKIEGLPEGKMLMIEKPEYKLKLGIFDQSNWIGHTPGDCQYHLNRATKTYDITMNGDGTWNNYSGQILQDDPSNVWWFMLFDCDRNVISSTNKKGRISTNILQYSLLKTNQKSEVTNSPQRNIFLSSVLNPFPKN
jgi:hypothetical protein